jgi:para-nitrobenzyl esterase
MRPEQIRAYLFRKDADQIMDMFHSKNIGIYESPRLFEDGVVLPPIPLADAFGSATYCQDIPLLIGTNRDEMKLFMLMSGEYTRTRFGNIPLMKNPDRYELDASYFSLMWKALGVDEPLHKLFQRGQRRLWCYRFDWDEIPALPVIRPDILIGATHVMEIPFVMRDLKGIFNPFQTFTKRNAKSRIETTLAVSAYWAHFARHGNPNRPDLPAWHLWQPGKIKNTLVIDAKGSGGIRMEHTDARVSSIKRTLRDDPRLSRNIKERCRLYAQLFLGEGLFGTHGTDAEYQTYGKAGKAPVPFQAFTRKPLL